MNATPMEPRWQLGTTNTNERIEFIRTHGTFYDVIFKVEQIGQEDKTYPTHMLILSCVSPVFEEEFYSAASFPNRNQLPVEITERRFTQRSFETMLVYAYSPHGQVPFEAPLHALETYHLARTYMISHLKQLCSNFLRSVPLSPEDVVPIYEDELHTEIVGLDQKCINVLETKPLLVIPLVVETARCETIEDFLQKEQLAIPSELVFLKKILEGARVRHFDGQGEIGNLTAFLRIIIFPFIRFLTMTAAQFAIAFDICRPTMSKQEGFEIFYKLCHPQENPNYDDFPPWCNTSTQHRIGKPILFQIIPRNVAFRERGLESRGLTSKLEIQVREGAIIISGLWIKYRRLIPMPRLPNEGNVPSTRCTLHMRNEDQMIAYDIVKELTMDENSCEKHLPFSLPLTVLRGETGAITLALSNIRSLEFYEFDSADLTGTHENFVFNIKVSNQRTRERDKLIAVSKIDYSPLYM